MSKSFKATKRTLKEYLKTHDFSMAKIDLSKHPNSKKKRKDDRYIVFGSPKHCIRAQVKKDNQTFSQLSRTRDKEELKKIVFDEINENFND